VNVSRVVCNSANNKLNRHFSALFGKNLVESGHSTVYVRVEQSSGAGSWNMKGRADGRALADSG
jgi:hypothetical protein